MASWPQPLGETSNLWLNQQGLLHPQGLLHQQGMLLLVPNSGQP